MNKEVEEAMKRLRECVRNSDDEYATVIIQQAFRDMERNFEIQLKLNKVLGDERDELQATIDKVEEVVRGGFQREEIEDKIKEILKEE